MNFSLFYFYLLTFFLAPLSPSISDSPTLPPTESNTTPPPSPQPTLRQKLKQKIYPTPDANTRTFVYPPASLPCTPREPLFDGQIPNLWPPKLHKKTIEYIQTQLVYFILLLIIFLKMNFF